MKTFIITEDQVKTLLSVLGTFPAERVMGAIDILRFHLSVPKDNKPTADATPSKIKESK